MLSLMGLLPLLPRRVDSSGALRRVVQEGDSEHEHAFGTIASAVGAALSAGGSLAGKK